MENNRELSMTAIMEPSQANVYGNIHGGEVMKMMDSTAGTVAARYVRGNVVTARVDELQFIKPVHVGDFVTCTGRVAYVGRTSIEVFVTVDVENFRTSGGREKALEAFVTLVAIDENGRPTPIEQKFEPKTKKEKAMYEHIRIRREFDEKRRVKSGDEEK